MPRSARALALLLLTASAHAGIPICTDPAPACPAGWTSSEVTHSAAFGTTPGVCASCTADPNNPGGTGCVFAQWTSPGSGTPSFEFPKAVLPIGAELTAVELVLRASACGNVGAENKDPGNGCTQTLTLGVRLTVGVAPGQGLDSLNPVTLLVEQEVIVQQQPFDGVVDFMGPSGHTEIFPERTEEICARITSPAMLVAFVEDGTGPFVFDHDARGESDASGCAPVTVTGRAFARIEFEVRYRICTPPITAFCFGTSATCPCANGGAPDSGCDNAQGTGGVRLFATGTPGQDEVVIRGTGFPVSSSPAALLLHSAGPVTSPFPFADGSSCLPLATLSYAGAMLASGGSSAIAIGSLGPGTRYYELWYRSQPASFCNAGAAFNASNALRIDWP